MGLSADRAADLVPPTESNATALALVSATASASTATGCGEGGRWFSWVCTQTHNVRFSADGDGAGTITDPATDYYFAANTVYSVQLNKQNSHVKWTASATAKVLYWLSSRS